ncbi:F0F1 ATP synthase subunit B [Candidatus Blochmannia ocreatus (nom. nud.)]|uniref:ATP synthase subunit b n=1 Tax=Candidatus Blochmannia ocreatus (nom. nud.) TaxID=251538 RepID=A0ABY4SSZ3_9ENTR|nr:F0F1 ATP synthase subunit B [Candidatus Blochmannia ocreatus]URJ25100.1 F0F1 ATP synthase subunit B [Candidatus Blochmannia ocreatus]
MNINATILGQAISFILFVWFCMKYVWAPFMSIIEKRRKEIADDFAVAKRVRQESDNANVAAKICLTQARIRAKEIITQANMCRTRILDEAKNIAEKEYNKFLSKAREQIAHERQCVSAELKKQVGQLIIESVEKIIECSMNETINSDIVNKVIDTLSYED